MSIQGPRHHQLANQMRQMFEQASGDAIDNWSAALVKVKQNLLDTYWAEFQRLQAEVALELVGEEAITDILVDSAEQTAIIYENTSNALESRLKALTTDPTTSSLPTPKPSEVILPKFDGNYTQWSSWRSQFMSRVYTTELPVHSKLDLLYAALTGEAKHCAGNVDGRDQADLDRVWAKLEQVYDNKYQLIRAHCDAILDLPVLTKPDPTAIRHMIDTFDKESDALKRFDFDVEGWSPILAVMMIKKLDAETGADWEMARDVTAVQSLSLVVGFLEKKIQALRNCPTISTEHKKPSSAESGSKRSHDNFHHDHGQRKRFKPENPKIKEENVSNPPPSCFTCVDKRHLPWHCQKFRSLAVPARLELISKAGLCPCCLIAKHSSSGCGREGCRRCDGAKHNSLLCPKYTVLRTNHIRKGRSSKARSDSNKE